VLSRVGAPTALRIVDGADHTLVPPGLSEDEQLASRRAVASALARWMEKVQGGGR